MVIAAAASRTSALSACLALSFVLPAGVTSQAQTPPAASSPPPAQASSQPKPVTGFVSSYEIMRTVRSAGFEPLAPPLREGTTYVLRATDFRGILMRVVLDARTGVIRDVTRIVPAGAGPYGMMAPAYGPPPYSFSPYGPPPSASSPYAPSPYGSSAEYDEPASGAGRTGEGAAPQLDPPAAVPALTRPAGSARQSIPPLPRPRPASLAAQSSQTVEAGGSIRTPPTGGNSATAKPRAAAHPDTIGITAAPPAPSAAPNKTPPVAPLAD